MKKNISKLMLFVLMIAGLCFEEGLAGPKKKLTYKKEACTNVAKILQSAKIVPVFKSKHELIAYKFQNIIKSSFFDRAGFRTKDVVVSLLVDGKKQKANKPEAMMQMIKLNKSETKTVFVRRGKRVIRLKYDCNGSPQ